MTEKEIVKYLEKTKYLFDKVKINDLEKIRNHEYRITNIILERDTKDIFIVTGELIVETYNTSLEYDSQIQDISFDIEVKYDEIKNKITLFENK